MSKKKKRSEKRSDAPSAPAVPGPLVPVVPGRVELVHAETDDHRQREDAAAIILVQAEEMMTRKKEEAMRLRAATLKEVDKLQAEAMELAKEQADEYAKDAQDAFKDSELALLLQIGKGLRCTALFSLPHRNEEKKRWEKMSVALTFEGPKDSHMSYFGQTVYIVADPEVTKRLTKAAKLNKLAGEQHAEAIQWQKKLSQMNRFERVTRANVAAHNLGKSDEGAALLEHLQSTMADDIAALPGG
jgi:hypothetical protein